MGSLAKKGEKKEKKKKNFGLDLAFKTSTFRTWTDEKKKLSLDLAFRTSTFKTWTDEKKNLVPIWLLGLRLSGPETQNWNLDGRTNRQTDIQVN
jgi:hypothetical protein